MSSPTYVKQLSYRPDIDGLRAFAVLAVIGYHFFPKYVRGGFVGVDIFFVISGFLIGGILHNSLSDGTFSFWEFYARRIRRIFPALILVMAAALVFGWFALLPDDYQNLGKHTLGGAGFVSNLILWRESGYFDVAMARKPLMHLWSLGIEEQFYIVLPLFLWGLSRKGMRPLTFLLLFFFVSLTANLAVYKRHPVFDFYAPLTRFWELLAGSALALMPRSPLFTRKALALDAFLGRLCFNSPPENDGRVLRDCLSFLGILILSASVLTMGVARFPGKNAVWPVLGAACVIIAGFCGTGQAGGWINRRLLAWKPLVAIGLISYPLYLWHWPLMSYAKIIYGETPHRDFRVALIFLAFVLASLTYVCLERPIRFGISARNAKTAALILVMLMSFAGGGGAIYRYKGLENREAVKQNWRIAQEMKSSHPIGFYERVKECGKKFDVPSVSGYCLYRNAHGAKTVLLLGDSHSYMSFDAISEFNAHLGVNTLYLESGSRVDTLEQQTNYHRRLLDLIPAQEYQRILKVFIIERGVIRVSGRDIDLSVEERNPPLGGDGFRKRMQYLSDRLSGDGKAVFIVAENPVLRTDIRNLVPAQPLRPLRKLKSLRSRYTPRRSDVLKHQGIYLEALNKVKGATIIPVIDTFCPKDDCLLTDEEGLPLYSDDDHLSIGAGSRFLVERVLKPYLEP